MSGMHACMHVTHLSTAQHIALSGCVPGHTAQRRTCVPCGSTGNDCRVWWCTSWSVNTPTAEQSLLPDFAAAMLQEIDISRLNAATRAVMLEELQAHSELPHHPHLTKLHAARITEDTLWVWSDFAPLGSLQQVVRRSAALRQRIHESDVWHFAAQVASGLQALHAANLMHRNLMPSNVLISSDYSLKVCDPGVKGLAFAGSTSAVRACYIPPEGVSFKLAQRCGLWHHSE